MWWSLFEPTTLVCRVSDMTALMCAANTAQWPSGQTLHTHAWLRCVTWTLLRISRFPSILYVLFGNKKLGFWYFLRIFFVYLAVHFTISVFIYFCPCTGLVGPQGLQEVEAPRLFKQSARECGKVVSPTHRPPLPHWDLRYSFLLKAEVDPRTIVRAEELSQCKIAKDPIVNRTAIFRIVALPRTGFLFLVTVYFFFGGGVYFVWIEASFMKNVQNVVWIIVCNIRCFCTTVYLFTVRNWAF
jgi:hypothetical protein